MSLAIFDLDHTLLRGDSDSSWLNYLVERGEVDGEWIRRTNQKFYEDYVAGRLIFDEYAAFAFGILKTIPMERLMELRRDYFTDRIKPMICPNAGALLAEHQTKGDTTIISTATNEFICQPVFEHLGADHIIATRLEQKDGAFTGRHSGTPNFREGKVTNILKWLEQNPEHKLDDAYFYSDSINDLPLLSKVRYPRPVNVDDALAAECRKNNWSPQALNT